MLLPYINPGTGLKWGSPALPLWGRGFSEWLWGMPLVSESRKGSHKMMHYVARLTLAHPSPPSCTLLRTLGVRGKAIKTLISWLSKGWSHRCQSYWGNNYSGSGIRVQFLLKWIFATDKLESYICLGWRRHLRPVSSTVNLWFVQEGWPGHLKVEWLCTLFKKLQ